MASIYDEPKMIQDLYGWSLQTNGLNSVHNSIQRFRVLCFDLVDLNGAISSDLIAEFSDIEKSQTVGKRQKSVCVCV